MFPKRYWVFFYPHLRTCLIDFREREREKERGRETLISCLLYSPQVPQQGTEPASWAWFMGWHLTNWATLARARVAVVTATPKTSSCLSCLTLGKLCVCSLLCRKKVGRNFPLYRSHVQDWWGIWSIPQEPYSQIYQTTWPGNKFCFFLSHDEFRPWKTEISRTTWLLIYGIKWHEFIESGLFRKSQKIPLDEDLLVKLPNSLGKKKNTPFSLSSL